MIAYEANFIRTINTVETLASKHQFTLQETPKGLLLCPVGSVLRTKYQFAKKGSIGEVSTFLQGYDACFNEIKRNNEDQPQ